MSRRKEHRGRAANQKNLTEKGGNATIAHIPKKYKKIIYFCAKYRWGGSIEIFVERNARKVEERII